MPSPARFWAIDLHVHTPASRDVKPQQYGDVTASDVVDAALAVGLDAIAVTDHNTAAWCDDIAAAAKGRPLAVLPGLEITTTEGHLLAIWEEGTPARVLDECLVRLGIDGDSRGKLDISADVGIAKAAAVIDSEGGVAIAAHIDQAKGLLGIAVAAHLKKTLLDLSLSGLEIVDAAKAAEVQRKVGDARELAFVRGSDVIEPGQPGHRLSAIGRRRTWIKAARPDLVGLRHALADPALRVRLDDPSADQRHPFISSVSITGGFLDGVTVWMSPDLNTLVGGTGTGKSLILECVRFVVDQQVDATAFPKISEEVNSRLEAALGQDSTISVVVALSSGETYVIERSYDSRASARPVVRQRIDGGELIPTDLAAADVFPISAFSQGEALEYARERVGRMALVDAALDLSDVNARLESLGEALRTNGQRLLSQREVVDGLTEHIGAEDDLTGRLRELEALFDSETVKNQKAWQTDDATIKTILESLPSPGAVELPIALCDGGAEVTGNDDLIEESKQIVSGLQVAVSMAISSIDEALAVASTGAGDIRTRWKTRYDEFKLELNKTLESVPGNKPLVALRQQLQSTQQQVLELQQAKRTLADVERPLLQELAAERSQLLEDLMKVRQDRRDRRRQRIKILNGKTNGIVRLDIPTNGDRAAFRAALNELKIGSRVKDAALGSIAEGLHPAQFAEAMLDGTYASLVDADAGVELDALSRLYVNIADKGLWESVLGLQEVDTPDTLTVKFKREQGDYVAIESLAHGQKCTAILVVLLADGDSPVIVDQPEDALHAPWIEDHLVDRLRSLRGQRQYVFATRSPGLVVSADAEQIITLHATAGRGGVEASGSLERHDLNGLVLHHLEGGRLPFKRRHRKLAPSVDAT